MEVRHSFISLCVDVHYFIWLDVHYFIWLDVWVETKPLYLP